jgi:hypothetical protein
LLLLDDVQKRVIAFEQIDTTMGWQLQADILLKQLIVLVISSTVPLDLAGVLEQWQALESKICQTLDLDGEYGADLTVAQNSGRDLAAFGALGIQTPLELLE